MGSGRASDGEYDANNERSAATVSSEKGCEQLGIALRRAGRWPARHRHSGYGRIRSRRRLAERGRGASFIAAPRVHEPAFLSG